MSRPLGRLATIFFSLLLAVFSVNLSGVMSVASAYADHGNNNNNPPKTQTVTPAAPTQTDVCGIANDTYTIPSTTGVTYSVSGQTQVANTYSATGTTKITASADDGYKLDKNADSSWKFVYTNIPCAVSVTPNAPIQNDLCGLTNDTYTIPTTSGVTYYVKVGLIYLPISAGTYNGFGNVTIKAVAKNGYVITGQDTWTLSFDASDCPVVAADPTLNDVCGTKNDTYTIPSTDHVTYKKLVGYFFLTPIFQTVVAGTYTGTGTVIIVAFPDSHYYVKGQDTWVLTFTDVDCVKDATPAAVTFNDVCGTDNDTYTIPKSKGVTYYVDGIATAAGTYNATGTVTITAQADKGYALTDGSTTSWSYKFKHHKCATPELSASGICSVGGVLVTIENTGKADGSAMIDGLKGTFTVPAGSSVQELVPFDNAVSFKANVLVADDSEKTLLDQPFDCTPGKGNTDPTTPTDPADPDNGNGNTNTNAGSGNTNGGSGSTTPSVTVSNPATTTATIPTAPVTELPDTGSNPLVSAFTLLVAGMATYGVMFFLVNRRELATKK